jgi:hypothetical protein
MKRITITFCTAALLFACNSEDKKTADTKAGETKIASSTSDSKAKTDEWVPVDSATMMKSWQENMTPGPHHQMLAKSEGTWDAETTMWMAPDAPPEKDKGVSVNKMMLGGRYLQVSFKGKMGGMPFEGSGTTGYDNTRKVFTSYWMDNMSTTPMVMEGTWDDATKSITSKGKMICAANVKEMEMREVFKMVDDNTQVMEMWGPDMKTGKEYKNMEIKYTRRK